MGDEKAEADVERDPKRADSRDPDGEYVGRIAEDDADAGEETGAERRAEEG
jgi:hypothetical protein